MNILITLNKEVYEQTIGKLPTCYLVSCIVDKVSNNRTITKKDKEYAIKQLPSLNMFTGILIC